MIAAAGGGATAEFAGDEQGLFGEHLEAEAAGCTYGLDDEPMGLRAETQADVHRLDPGACTDARSHAKDSVRTEASGETYEAATKRFEVRLAPSELARWRAIAADHGCKVAELVRVAVDFAAAYMPPGHVTETLQREGAERMQRALALAAGMAGTTQGTPDA